MGFNWNSFEELSCREGGHYCVTLRDGYETPVTPEELALAEQFVR